MNIIVAVDSEWGIGYQGDLLARVREDLQNFARLTTGKTVIWFQYACDISGGPCLEGPAEYRAAS